MLKAGRLRHRVTIEALTLTQDSTTGEVTESWTAFAANLPAEVAPVSVREFISARQIQAEVTTMILIRFLPGLRPDMRIVHGTKVYDPLGFLPDKDSNLEYITIPCKENVAESI